MGCNCSAGDDSTAFLDAIKTVRLQVVQSLDFTRRPFDLEVVDLVVIAQAKVDPQIALREIAASAQHFSCLDEIARSSG